MSTNSYTKTPTVLITSLGHGPNGPFIPDVLKLFPNVTVIDQDA